MNHFIVRNLLIISSDVVLIQIEKIYNLGIKQVKVYLNVVFVRCLL